VFNTSCDNIVRVVFVIFMTSIFLVCAFAQIQNREKQRVIFLPWVCFRTIRHATTIARKASFSMS